MCPRSCSRKRHTALEKIQILLLTTFLTGEIVAKCQQMVVDTTNAHWLNMAHQERKKRSCLQVLFVLYIPGCLSCDAGFCLIGVYDPAEGQLL